MAEFKQGFYPNIDMASEGSAGPYEGIPQLLDLWKEINPVDFAHLGPMAAAGLSSRFRVPMKIVRADIPNQDENPMIRDLAGPDEWQSIKYRFRNLLGQKPGEIEASMRLSPKDKEAHISFLRASNKAATPQQMKQSAYEKGRDPGVDPKFLYDAIGRLAEDLAGAGYTKFSSDPTSQGRGRLYERIVRKLKSTGQFPEGMEYEQSVPITGDEGPAVRAARMRKGKNPRGSSEISWRDLPSDPPDEWPLYNARRENQELNIQESGIRPPTVSMIDSMLESVGIPRVGRSLHQEQLASELAAYSRSHSDFDLEALFDPTSPMRLPSVGRNTPRYAPQMASDWTTDDYANGLVPGTVRQRVLHPELSPVEQEVGRRINEASPRRVSPAITALENLGAEAAQRSNEFAMENRYSPQYREWYNRRFGTGEPLPPRRPEVVQRDIQLMRNEPGPTIPYRTLTAPPPGPDAPFADRMQWLRQQSAINSVLENDAGLRNSGAYRDVPYSR